ncbi:PepSY-associated TM helix domain-containing protein [Tunicatimonas pelagia]|uniref:PepSY-associated TM helix domain-containing protein n=1 Tax=Tunicatimonas pelagia TaxID=931531 RepID=UPI0026660758|nr:PepSY-associated TM helix domain-containing protein [Tunicatimonas pelagia]WKN43012.1 PepSY-associated TM helix domain-containing protein [Tunicatimonas pelagia]
MKLNKQALFRIHSWIGVKLSVLFFIVCFSGTLATVSHEMDWLFNPEMRVWRDRVSPDRVSPDRVSPDRVSPDRVSRNQQAQNVYQAFPQGEITFWMGSREPYLCDVVYVKNGDRRDYVFVNPYSGEVQGSTVLTFQRFFRDLHYFLFIPFQIGHFTVLIFGFMLLVSLLTALVFYKKWYRKLFELKTGKGALVLFRSLHRLVGVWSVPFTLLFSVTGIWYFVERANVGGVADTANISAPQLAEPIDSATFAEVRRAIDYDRAVEIAQQEIKGLDVKDILPPAKPTSAIYLTGKSHEPLVRNRANRVYLHPTTYEVLKVQRANALPTVTWLNDITDPLHFGYWGGLVTKIIWFLLGLGISSLVLTGIWISQKRRIKRTAQCQVKAQRLGPWQYANWTVYGVMMVFMYGTLVTRYQASLSALLLITAGWLLFIGAAWYLFEYRIKKVVQKKLA